MIFAIQGYVFMEMVATAAKAVPAKPVVPILDCLLFDVRDGVLTLKAGDTAVEVCVIRPLPSPVEGEARPFCVPFKELSSTLKGLSSELTFETDCESWMTVTWGDGEVHLPALASWDWPEVPAPAKTFHKVSFGSACVCSALSLAEYAAAKDDARPALGGIHLEFFGDRLEVVATDARKLAIAGVPHVVSRRAFDITIPLKAAQLLRKVFAHAGKVCLTAGKDWAVFTSDEGRVSCRLYSDVFPNYRSIIPSSHSTSAEMDRVALLAAGGRIGACASPGRTLRLTISGGCAVLSAEDPGRNVMGEESLPCEIEGEDVEIGFNADRFFEVVDNIPAQRVSIFIQDASHVAVIRPVECGPADGDVMAVLSPLLLDS